MRSVCRNATGASAFRCGRAKRCPRRRAPCTWLSPTTQTAALFQPLGARTLLAPHPHLFRSGERHGLAAEDAEELRLAVAEAAAASHSTVARCIDAFLAAYLRRFPGKQPQDERRIRLSVPEGEANWRSRTAVFVTLPREESLFAKDWCAAASLRSSLSLPSFYLHIPLPARRLRSCMACARWCGCRHWRQYASD